MLPILFVFYYNPHLSELKEQLLDVLVYTYMDDVALVVQSLFEAQEALRTINDT